MYLVVIVTSPKLDAPIPMRRERSRTGAAPLVEDALLRSMLAEAPDGPTIVEERVTGIHETEAALRRAVQSRDEVLRVVSHDLREPLQCIALTAQQLGEVGDAGPQAPALRKAVDRILRASQSMARLIDDLLDVASIEAGRLGLRPAALRADALLRDSLDAHQAQAESRKVVLSVAAAAPVTIVGDQGRLLQVLSNIIGNALKLVPAGGAITMSAIDDGDVVRFCVSDTGPGIAPEHAPRVFEPFWQGRPSDCRGRGLGLTIAKGIVEAHDGRIWLDSELGRGTTVSFTVPKASPPALT